MSYNEEYLEEFINSFGPLSQPSARSLANEIKELETLAINLTQEEEDRLMAELLDKTRQCVCEIINKIKSH